jgi:uncharacterized protein DUF4224
MNTPSIGLTKAELHEVTGFKYPQKQIHALALMGIPFRVRPDGTPFVARAVIEGPPTRSTPEQEAVLTLI